MLRILKAFTLLLALSACAGPDHNWASDGAVAQANYQHEGPPTITLFTVISNRSGSGAHSALLINGSQRVMFDPAGSWHHPNLPERNDVHYGMTDKAVDFYVDYHARITYHVVRQDVIVSAQVAEQALRAVQAYGAVGEARCAASVSDILNDLPGFQSISQTYFPKAIMKAFASFPGVREQSFYDDDPDKNFVIVTQGI